MPHFPAEIALPPSEKAGFFRAGEKMHFCR
jgi:hypothetical protein